MKNIAINPVREGSKRLPQKNVHLLGGSPLSARSILDAKKFPDLVHAVYISTDDPQIKNIALPYGTKVIDRPIQISGDHEPKFTALKPIFASRENPVDWVSLMQSTNPMRPQGLLSRAFQSMQGRGAASLLPATRIYQKFDKIVNDVFVPSNCAGRCSQDLEPLYFENRLLYIIASDLVLQDRIMGTKAFPMVVNHPFASVDIDVWEDLVYANYLYKLSNITE